MVRVCTVREERKGWRGETMGKERQVGQGSFTAKADLFEEKRGKSSKEQTQNI